MLLRTQISLDSEMRKRARARAAELGVSLAEYIRRLVARDLGTSIGRVDAAVVFDLGRTQGSDVATEKDAMIGEAVAGRRPGRKRRR